MLLYKVHVYFLCVISIFNLFCKLIIKPFYLPFIQSFIYSFARSFVRLFVRIFVRSFVRTFVRSVCRSFLIFVSSFLHSFVRSIVNLIINFVRSFVCIELFPFQHEELKIPVHQLPICDSRQIITPYKQRRQFHQAFYYKTVIATTFHTFHSTCHKLFYLSCITRLCVQDTPCSIPLQLGSVSSLASHHHRFQGHPDLLKLCCVLGRTEVHI